MMGLCSDSRVKPGTENRTSCDEGAERFHVLPPPDRGPVSWGDMLGPYYGHALVVLRCFLATLSVCNDPYRESALESESRLLLGGLDS